MTEELQFCLSQFDSNLIPEFSVLCVIPRQFGIFVGCISFTHCSDQVFI